MQIHWIWLATRPGISAGMKMRVLEQFGTAENVYNASEGEYGSVEGLPVEAAAALEDKNLTTAWDILRDCEEKNISVCNLRQPEYPARLRAISDPPLVLYYKGRLPDWDAAPVIAAVGTRKASVYGLSVAQRMGYQIAAGGGIVVSGLAAGIDGTAMRGALLSGGSVVGVLGFGADVIYPKSNRDLFEETEKRGCLISEFPPQTPPEKWNFPRRNRIISGLSCGVVVIEAPEKSGSLITAHQALDQGRDVFVVPGNVDTDSFVGSNQLLRDGATPVRGGWDILQEYVARYPDVVRMPKLDTELPEPYVAQQPQKPKISPARKGRPELRIHRSEPVREEKKTIPALSDSEKTIVDLLASPKLLDDAILESGLPASQFLATLTLLQIRGIVTQLPGKILSLK